MGENLTEERFEDLVLDSEDSPAWEILFGRDDGSETELELLTWKWARPPPRTSKCNDFCVAYETWALKIGAVACAPFWICYKLGWEDEEDTCEELCPLWCDFEGKPRCELEWCHWCNEVICTLDYVEYTVSMCCLLFPRNAICGCCCCMHCCIGVELEICDRRFDVGEDCCDKACLPCNLLIGLPALLYVQFAVLLEHVGVACWHGCQRCKKKKPLLGGKLTPQLESTFGSHQVFLEYLMRISSLKVFGGVETEPESEEGDLHKEKKLLLAVQGNEVIRVEPETVDETLKVLLPPLRITEGPGLIVRNLEKARDLESIEAVTSLVAVFDTPSLRSISDIKAKRMIVYKTPQLEWMSHCHVTENLFIFGASNLTKWTDVLFDKSFEGVQLGVKEFPCGTREVAGDLTLKECDHLVALGHDLRVVRGKLTLKNCRSLKHIAPWAEEFPQETLEVQGNLSLRGCTSLRELPAQLRCMSYEINLEGCEHLTSISEEIFLPERQYKVLLSGSGITEEEITRISAIRPFVVFRNAKEKPRVKLSTLADVAEYFGGCTASALEENVPPAYVDSFVRFMNKLQDSEDYDSHQSEICARVKEVLTLICEDPLVSTEIVVHIADAVDACQDKPIWALNQMTALSRVAHAKGDLDELRKVGLGVMRLGIVHKHARQLGRSRGYDEVSLFLQLEVDLRSFLQLPVSTGGIAHNVDLPVKVVTAIIAEAQAVTEDSEVFQAWLETWPPWQQEMRRRAAASWSYDDLQVPSKRLNIQGETNLLGDSLEDPVLFNGHLCSFEELLKRWVETGLDFFNVAWPDIDVFFSKLVKVIPDVNARKSRRSLRPESLPKPGRRKSSLVSESSRRRSSKRSSRSKSGLRTSGLSVQSDPLRGSHQTMER